LSDAFRIENGLKQGDSLLPLLLNFRLCYLEDVRKSGGTVIKCNTSVSAVCKWCLFIGQKYK